MMGLMSRGGFDEKMRRGCVLDVTSVWNCGMNFPFCSSIVSEYLVDRRNVWTFSDKLLCCEDSSEKMVSSFTFP